MNRRDFLKIFGASAVVIALPRPLLERAANYHRGVGVVTFAPSKYVLQAHTNMGWKNVAAIRDFEAHREVMEMPADPGQRHQFHYVNGPPTIDAHLILPDQAAFQRLTDDNAPTKFRAVGDQWTIEFDAHNQRTHGVDIVNDFLECQFSAEITQANVTSTEEENVS